MAEISQDLKEKLSQALSTGDAESSVQLTEQAVEQGVDPLKIIQEVVVPTLTEVGNKFQAFEIFLPELMSSGQAAKQASEILEQALVASGGGSSSLGTVLIGTVENDVHDIGKNIVGTLLKAHGFKVIDLGRSVAPTTFLEEAEKNNAEVIALSALMTTTRSAARSTVDIFEQTDVRDQYKIIIGGGSMSQDYADEIRADGFAPDAASAVDLCKELLNL